MWQTIQTILQKSGQQLQDHAVNVLPGVLASVVILALGALLAWLLSRALDRLLRAAQFDRRADLLGLASSLESFGVASALRLVVRTSQVLILFLALFLALYSLHPGLGDDLALRSLLYLPHLIVAVAILIIGALAGRFLSRSVLIAAVNAELRSARLLSGLTHCAVVFTAVAIAFEHLGIGRTTVLVAFSTLFGGVVLAAAISLGLGSQDLVRRWLGEAFDSRPAREKQTAIHHW